jgi:phenylacetate-coenzyme A ligase PaaK-like adenylate-forming protein
MSRADAELIGRCQRQRLDRMIRHDRYCSPFYRELHADLPGGVPDLSRLPPVTTSQLMEHFDEVVTDRAVTRASLDAFLGDPGNIGQPFLGRYLAATSSGSTGHPGVFVQDSWHECWPVPSGESAAA